MVYIFKSLESSTGYDISFFSILNRVSLWIEILDLGVNVGGAWSTIFKTIPKLQDMAPEGQHVRIWAIWSLRANIGELSVERNPRLPLIILFYLALNTPWLSWNTWGSKAWAVLVPPTPPPPPRIPNFLWLLSLLGMRVTKTCCKLSFPNDSFCSYIQLMIMISCLPTQTKDLLPVVV